MINSKHLLNTNNFLKKINKQFGGFPSKATYNPDGLSTIESDWSLESKPDIDLPGYFTALAPCNNNVILKHKDTIVMSLTPMETESHLIAQCGAEGHVVIAGLGLAMITLSVLRKKTVKKVTVLEIDSDIINMYPKVLDGQSRTLWEQSIESGRLTVIQADCKAPLPEPILRNLKRVDYLWVDIWNNLGNSEARSITTALSEQLKPAKCDWWGCELELGIYAVIQARDDGTASVAPNAKAIKAQAKKWQLPMSVLKMDSKQERLYCQLVFMAVKNITRQESNRNWRRASALHPQLQLSYS